MKRLRVNIPNHEYELCIGNGILASAGILVKEIFQGEKIAVVTDSNVFPLYAEKLVDALKASGFGPHVITIPAGEASKSFAVLQTVYEELLQIKIDRKDLIIALGGGVVGDLCGFAAATFMRGVPFVQVPTTLVSQVDSSVGGKVGVNLPAGKNLAGAFYQPKMVIADPACLETLPDRVLTDGMGEVVKYGAIADKQLFEKLGKIKDRTSLLREIADIIYTCCDIKRSVVEQDEKDTGLRMILNFGHTFGHAIEKYYDYKTYTHGEAVAIGMVMAGRFGEKKGLTAPRTTAMLEQQLRQYGLPTQAEADVPSLLAAVETDKKAEGEHINLILLKEIGSCFVQKVSKAELAEA